MFPNINGVLAIQYCGRSGSYLLSSLLDSHPNIISLPPHSFMRAHRIIARIYENGVFDNWDYDKFSIELAEAFPLLFTYNSDNALGHEETLFHCARHMKFGVSKEGFIHELKNLLPYAFALDSNYEIIYRIFCAIHFAYARSNGRNIQDQVWISWQYHFPANNNDLDALELIFNNLVFLTTIREPIKNLDSHFYYHMVTLRDKERPYAHTLDLFYRSLIRKNRKFPEFMIKFEDMHCNTKNLMLTLCRVLEIEYHHALEETTIDGSDFLFPSKGKCITGLDAELSRENDLQILQPNDAMLLEYFLHNLYFKLNYDKKKFNYPGIHSEIPAFDSALKNDSAVISLLYGIFKLGLEDIPTLIVPTVPN